MTIRTIADRVVAGTPFPITVDLEEGEHWVWIPQDLSWSSEPKVHYTSGLSVGLDGGAAQVSDHRNLSGSVIERVTFPTPGSHTVMATGHSTGGEVVSPAVTVQVAAAGPPAFVLTAPADGTTIDLDEAGGRVTVVLTTTSDYFPLTAVLSWDGVSTSAQFSSAQFETTVALGPMPLGARTIAVTVSDRDGLGSTQTCSVTGRDVAPPHVRVLEPVGSANVVGDADGSVTVRMIGTASDSQAGMAGNSATVAWGLSPTGARTTAHPLAVNDFSNWTADVPLTGFGAHTVYIWAGDQAGNAMPVPLEVPLVVISAYVPATLDERLNEREYLAALLSFARDHVVTSGTAHVDTASLVGVLGQPLDRLSQPLSAAADRGSEEVNQLRVPLELLRAYISSTNTPTAPGASGERAYRRSAYESLLAAAGTSYQELRGARGADSAEREALAARLGLRLASARPDALDRLVLDDVALAEGALELMFGLPATVGDPLRSPSTPQLLAWQLDALALTWADQDQHPNQPQPFAVLADPDNVAASDVAPGPKGEPIRALLDQRRTQLTTFAKRLEAILTANPTDARLTLAGMTHLAVPDVALDQLEIQDAQGEDISEALSTAGLRRSDFLFLRELGRLADAGPVTASEWDDTVAVLTSAWKRRQYETWRSQETAFVLSPDFFVLSDIVPEVSPYRADRGARSSWQAVIRTRIGQRQDLIDGVARAVAATEQITLPILRDALLADLESASAGGAGDEMTNRFLVDVLAGGTMRTTRIRQAIESLQSLLIAVRSRDLPPSRPAAAWSLSDVDAFTNAWTWMREIGNWQAATMAFLFPERRLDPALLLSGADGVPSGPLSALYTAIRGSGPFTAADAAAAAATYLDGLQVALPLGSFPNLTRSMSFQTQVRAIAQGQGPTLDREIAWVVPLLLAQRLQSAGDFQSALDWYWSVYPYDVAAPESVFDTIASETSFRPDLTFPALWTAALNPFSLVADRPTPYTRYTLLGIIQCHLDFADAEFTRETDESTAHARALYVAARRLISTQALQPQQPLNVGEPALAIPELESLRGRAELQLAKLRQGRNIAGIPRAQAISAAAISQPTPYRFKTLMERAKQLIAQAGQMEAGYLAALEKYDERNLRLYDALKAIDLNAAQVTLAVSRVQEARDAVGAADAQLTKANVMNQTYADAIAAPPNRYEQDLLGEYQDMRTIRDHLALTDAAIGIMQAAANASSLVDEVFSGGSKGLLAAGIATATAIKGGMELAQNGLDAQMQANQLQAGIEQRRAEWRIQQASAQQDVLVAAAQVAVAGDQVNIAAQEQGIAQLQYGQAVATLKFLNDQFTNADLYLWMSTTLGGVYRYFLQQATAIARLTQAQLAFERAERPLALIRTDYWQSPAELMSAARSADRRGLAGAEQLSEDLARLDDYAFQSERRRLNLSQTFSLAKLMPVEFLDFRRTGTLAFATPMALFDADFPGHYLRLIRQVRTTIVALLPPDRGVRATLFSSGISRVTSGQDARFSDIVLRHDPAVVALTSAVGASGVFDLDLQADMLLPFESSGVDTTWELQLPPAANPIDFSTIADVLITVDYTALYDDTYRNQVIARLNGNRTRGADCAFSLARDFPDQWYDLHNSADPSNRSIAVGLRDVDFPLGVAGLTTAGVTVQLASGGVVPATMVSLMRGTAGGPATTSGGIASTRRGNAAGWTDLIGTSPVGEWTLAFGSDASPLFDSGDLDDIVLVISWTGQAPFWTP